MVKAILGTKVGMTQIFEEVAQVESAGDAKSKAPKGGGEPAKVWRVVPVTVVEAGPCVVVQKKTADSDGYEAVQMGYRKAKERRVNRPLKGHFDKFKVAPTKVLREFRGATDLEAGKEIRVDIFTAGDTVDVIGTSKGKGFAGVVKRYHWHGGDMTHGSMIHRKPQSAGATDAARVFKNTGRPGHMGHERVTVKRLRVVRVDTEKNLLLIQGSIPGPNGGLVTVRGAK